MASPGNRHCAKRIGALSFPVSLNYIHSNTESPDGWTKASYHDAPRLMPYVVGRVANRSWSGRKASAARLPRVTTS